MATLHLPYNLTFRDYQSPVWKYMMQPEPGLRALTIWPRRNGKDLIAINILVAKALQRTGLYLYIGPLQTQTRQIVWKGATDDGRKFLDYIPPGAITKKRDSTMEIELVNDSMIKVVGSDQYDSLMGLNAMGAVFTEFSLQKPEAWDYIRPMLTSNGGWALFNGTARGMNHMYAMYKMALKNPKWFVQYLTRDDTGYPSIEAIEEDRRSGMRESLIQQEYYNDWSASTEETAIPLDIIMPAVENTLKEEEYSFMPSILGVDVAFAAKGDKATIAHRQGRMLHGVDSYQGKDNMAFAATIVRKIKEVHPAAVFIDAGRGEGVYSRLYQLGYEDIVIPVNFGGKVYDELHANMKALMWMRCRDWFFNPNRPSIPHNETLIKQLSTPMMLDDEKHRVKIETKQMLKTRGEKSPDEAEAVTLTFAEEIELEDMPTEREKMLGITPQMKQILVRGDGLGQSPLPEYDPLNFLNRDGENFSLTG